jgi:D-aminopeptidase
MKVKIHYRITQDRAGIPQDYSGARHFVINDGQAVEDLAKSQLAADYQVPLTAVEICRIES